MLLNSHRINMQVLSPGNTLALLCIHDNTANTVGSAGI